jgi:hypothetical protein
VAAIVVLLFTEVKRTCVHTFAIPDDAAFGCGTHHAFTAKSENLPQY